MERYEVIEKIRNADRCFKDITAGGWASFQGLVRETIWITDDPLNVRLGYLGLGLTGEAGEVAELLKRCIKRKLTLDEIINPSSGLDLIGELGDTLWYLVALCNLFKLDLHDVISFNAKKTKFRMTNRIVSGLQKE